MTIIPADWLQQQEEISAIRKQVFVVEQSVPEELEWDGKDSQAKHWLAVDNDGQGVATIRILADGHIGRMAVLKPYRHKGLGSALLKAAIKYAKNNHLQQVYLHAQVQAIPFYQQAGFIVQGPEFMDAGIAHRMMHMSLSGKDTISG